MTVTCGIDWSEKHHDVALIDETGTLLTKRRISDDANGWRVLVELLAEHGDHPDALIPVAIETSRGLLVSCLRATGRMVYAINPLAAVGYVWSFASLRAPGPRAHYDHRRAEGDRHSSALRNTFNRMLGCLFHCLQNDKTYNELVAFSPRLGSTCPDSAKNRAA